MLREILSERQRQILDTERSLLERLAAALDELGAGARRDRVAAARRGLDPLFLLAVAGGREAALDALLAALLGDRSVPGSSGARLRWIDRPGRSGDGEPGAPFPAPEDAERVEVELPALEHLAVAVAPPGHAGGWGARADLALFVTSTHRTLGPPEHPLLLAAADGARALLIVVDGVEMLRLAEDVDRMEEAAVVTAERLLGFQPLAQGVSTASASVTAGEAAPRESLVPTLASRIVGELRRSEVVRPKLLGPLEAALEELDAARAEVAGELADLADDLDNLEALEATVARFDGQAEAALREACDQVAEAVEAYGRRASAFLRRTSRPIPLPVPDGVLKRRFRERAVADLPERFRVAARGLEERLGGAASAARQGLVERLTSHPTRRSRTHPPAEAGEAPGSTAAARDPDRGPEPAPPPGDPVQPEAERAWTPPDGASVAAGLRRTSVLSWILVVVGLTGAAGPLAAPALGLAQPGAVPPFLAAALGGVAILAAVGLAEIRRRGLARRLSAELPELRRSATAALAAGAERAAGRARERLAEPARPYVSAVIAERERLTAGRDALERLAGELDALRSRVGRL